MENDVTTRIVSDTNDNIIVFAGGHHIIMISEKLINNHGYNKVFSEFASDNNLYNYNKFIVVNYDKLTQ